jgi:hypothetical protein
VQLHQRRRHLRRRRRRRKCRKTARTQRPPYLRNVHWSVAHWLVCCASRHVLEKQTKSS